jgi:hypothetical protein
MIGQYDRAATALKQAGPLNLGFQKSGSSGPAVHDRSNHANELILAFDCDFVPVWAEDENIRIARYRVRRRAPRQGNFGISLHEVLIENRHLRIGRVCLTKRRPTCAEQDKHCDLSPGIRFEDFLAHDFLPALKRHEVILDRFEVVGVRGSHSSRQERG